MATIRDHLINAAKEMADSSVAQVAELDQIITDIQKQKTDAEAQRQKAHLALQRLAQFPAQIGMDFLCPRCWMNYKKSVIRPVASTTREDIFRCPECHWDISVS